MGRSGTEMLTNEAGEVTRYNLFVDFDQISLIEINCFVLVSSSCDDVLVNWLCIL